MAIAVSSAVYPSTTFAVTPEWSGATCYQMFPANQFYSVSTIKVYGSGANKYALIAGYLNAADPTSDIYRSDWDGLSETWSSPPQKVVTLSTDGQDEFDVEVMGVRSTCLVVSTSGIATGMELPRATVPCSPRQPSEPRTSVSTVPTCTSPLLE